MPPDQKYQFLTDCLSAFITAKVVTRANILAPIRIRVDKLYQSFCRLVGYHTAFSASTCYLCVSFWTSLYFHHGEFLSTYAVAYLVNAFSERNEILKRDN
jgi:hypothetical protein